MIGNIYDEFQDWKVGLVERWKEKNLENKRTVSLQRILSESDLDITDVDWLRLIVRQRIIVYDKFVKSEYFFSEGGSGGDIETRKYNRS
ncbi:MAG: hypothetical protein ISS01_02875 [Nanoarchaeota archaeon]|nr:hypothetical protein [Nanoarchaeota archaeon]